MVLDAGTRPLEVGCYQGLQAALNVSSGSALGSHYSLKERGGMVKVLVGKRAGGTFFGFWAEFEGEKISSYEDTRPDKNIAYTLYKCTAYNWEAYRVHIADESNLEAPAYELRPFDEDQHIRGLGSDYTEPYAKEQIAMNYPLFLKDIDYFQTYAVDPGPSRR